MSNDLTQPSDQLFQDIGQLIDAAKQRAAVAVNAELTLLYWQVGTRIQTEVLQGQRAEYGKQVIRALSPTVTTIDETAKPVQIKVEGTVIPHVRLYAITALES